MKLIPLTQGLFAKVDDEDYDFLMQWKWYAGFTGKDYYAQRKETVENGGQRTVWMHKVILGISESDLVGDHKDHDTLNNQKSNLRKATAVQNRHNSTPHGTSKYLGVSIKKDRRGSKTYTYYMADFSTKEERASKRFPFTACGELCAAVFYDTLAEKNYGEFANLNFK